MSLKGGTAPVTNKLACSVLYLKIICILKQWCNFAGGCPWARDGWVPHWLRSSCANYKNSKRATGASRAAWGPEAKPLVGSSSGVRGIFFRGGKVTFSDLFPAWNTLSPVKKILFWYTPNKFQWFRKVKKKKKGSSAQFHTSSLSIFSFPLSSSQFFFFSPPFPFFSLPLFSRYVSRNFPLFPRASPPACYATGVQGAKPLGALVFFHEETAFSTQTYTYIHKIVI